MSYHGEEPAEWTMYKYQRSKAEFTFGEATVIMDVPLPGEHYAQNAMSVSAIVRTECSQYPAEVICKAAESFKGVERRMNIIGRNKKGVLVVDDYAHNPQKLAGTVRAIHEITTGKIFAVFQSTGLKSLNFYKNGIFREMENCLRESDEICILPPYLKYGGYPTVEEVVS